MINVNRKALRECKPLRALRLRLNFQRNSTALENTRLVGFLPPVLV